MANIFKKLVRECGSLNRYSLENVRRETSCSRYYLRIIFSPYTNFDLQARARVCMQRMSAKLNLCETVNRGGKGQIKVGYSALARERERKCFFLVFRRKKGAGLPCIRRQICFWTAFFSQANNGKKQERIFLRKVRENATQHKERRKARVKQCRTAGQNIRVEKEEFFYAMGFNTKFRRIIWKNLSYRKRIDFFALALW